jgi:uncharacterized protein (DUF2141 family)
MSIKAVLCAVMLSFTFSVFAQSNEFTLEGEIIFEKKGDIYVYLVTEEIFKKPFTGIQNTVIKIGKDEFEKKKVAFKFKEIPPGTYGIRCFQDVNGNGKLDKGLFGPKEPWGMSWQGNKPDKWPKFAYIAFEVKSNMTNIKIELE